MDDFDVKRDLTYKIETTAAVLGNAKQWKLSGLASVNRLRYQKRLLVVLSSYIIITLWWIWSLLKQPGKYAEMKGCESAPLMVDGLYQRTVINNVIYRPICDSRFQLLGNATLLMCLTSCLSSARFSIYRAFLFSSSWQTISVCLFLLLHSSCCVFFFYIIWISG